MVVYECWHVVTGNLIAERPNLRAAEAFIETTGTGRDEWEILEVLRSPGFVTYTVTIAGESDDNELGPTPLT